MQRESAKDVLSVAVVQMTSTNSTSANERLVLDALSEVEKRATSAIDLVVFPENVWFLRLVESESIPDFSQAASFHKEIQKWVDRTHAAVHLGAVPVVHGGGKPFAATVVFEPGRAWHTAYTKVHLFDVDVAGHKPVRESDHLRPGLEPSIWEFRGWKFGCAICYDVRFAELFSKYAKAEVDAMFLPSAFLVPTGRQHWEILVRARAIESQAYFLAPAQSGDHTDHSGQGSNVRKTYGRSMIVDPWGRVVAAGAAERSGIEILMADLSKEEIVKVRGQIPMRAHRRL